MTGPLRRALDDMPGRNAVDDLVNRLARMLQTPHMTRADLQRAVDRGVRAAYLELAQRFHDDAAELYARADRMGDTEAMTREEFFAVFAVRNRAASHDTTAAMIRNWVAATWNDPDTDTESDT